MRGTTAADSPTRTLSLRSSATASGSENVVSSTRASGLLSARRAARCRATTVLPVPAEPVTRTGPSNSRSTKSRCEGWRKTIHFSQGKLSACSSSATFSTTRKRRSASGCWNGSATVTGAGTLRTPVEMNSKQRLAGLGGQVCGDVEEVVLGRRQNVVDPVRRHTDGHELARIERPEAEGRLAPPRRPEREHIDAVAEIELLLHRPRRRHLLDALAHLDDLDGTCLGMRLDAPALGPLVGVVVVADVGQQEALRRLVDDDADVAARPARPEIRVLGVADAVPLQARMLRVGLQVEHGGLDRLLLVARQLGERGGEAVSDAEFHLGAPG